MTSDAIPEKVTAKVPCRSLQDLHMTFVPFVGWSYHGHVPDTYGWNDLETRMRVICHVDMRLVDCCQVRTRVPPSYVWIHVILR